jgi:subtilisin family serine protease
MGALGQIWVMLPACAPSAMRLRLAAIAAVLLAVLGAAGGASAAPPDRYIVVLKDGVRDPGAVAREHARRDAAQIGFVYHNALKGYAARIPAARLAAVRADSRVAYVEPDGEAHALTTQANATWGLDRIDQHALPLSTTFTYTNDGADYNAAGDDVKAYIIDTGIRYDHVDFAGRAIRGTDTVTSGGTGADCNGHGTHVAGTVGGATYGVAKGVTLVSVRVLGCRGAGTFSGVIAGIDWVTGNHQAGQPAVANMSLGGGANSAVDTAVRNSIADGVSYAIAAGNGNFLGIAQNACNFSPARVTKAMTVSATNRGDKKASWANYGGCVDWFAPGVGITSDWWSSASATNTISGTSMATPHTTGVAALYLESNPTASPADVAAALDAKTTKGIVTSSKTAKNNLLFTDY